ncbi:SMP-30/gluconolactonase/LRE family protein [Rathayibacter sp. VKM Ac-2754]|uniref:SMP-30/gluconolactonase/LRE family protein n=1 Tax=Rathayibacter sp. VKM Ac-2754 TaxID=2609251 RepID=UPI001359A89F|nr:SMP-30/gluconolactonase/LRE family protein [Rathayibacter sp. VKM Ac-2754]MWV60061.1 hypothetical protein [Rathayibacter sp. VKM Ac-2754]
MTIRTTLRRQLPEGEAADLEQTLLALRDGVADILGDGLVGVHLTGSFALGCGDRASDADVVIVSAEALSADRIAAARALHRSLPDLPLRWAGRLEGSWVTASALRDPVGAHGLWLYVDNGSRELVESSHDDSWNARWLLRHRAIALAGESAATLVPEIDPRALRAEALQQADARAVWIRDDPAVLVDDWAQPYAVLTAARLLWTATSGTVAGKAESAVWLGRTEPRWRGLLEAAVDQRRRGATADPTLAGPAADFVRWVAAEARSLVEGSASTAPRPPTARDYGGRMIDATPAGTPSYILSEGPVWDAGTGRVTWVDIEAGAVLSAPLTAEGIGAISRSDVGEQVGCALPLGDGRVLVALTRCLAILEVDGSLTRGSELLPEGHRFNDGSIDPQGRLVVGSLTLGESVGDDVLLRLEHDGSVTVLDHDLRLSNGLGWSPDGSVMYSVDTESGVVHRRSYPGESARETFLEPEEGVFVDGITVDSEGRLWCAIWGGSGVRVYDAEGRRVEGEGIAVDAPHVSSIAFAGEELDVAIVSSASRDLSAEERAAHPFAGGLWTARPGVRGLPATRWVEARLP